MPNPVVHVERRGLDAPSLAGFHRDVFGWEGDQTLSIEGYPIAEIGTGRLTAGIGPVPAVNSRPDPPSSTSRLTTLAGPSARSKPSVG